MNVGELSRALGPRLLPLAVLVVFSGCGYVGPVLPPSPQLPLAITDLRVIERGDNLLITFSTPARTTDSLPVDHFSAIDLRVGPDLKPFDFERWAGLAKEYAVALPPTGDPDNPLPIPLSKKIPVAEWIGKGVAVAVRASIKKKDHYSSWSNRVVLEVVSPLLPPQIEARPTAKGLLLKWRPDQAAKEYRIYRRSAPNSVPAQIGVSQTSEYLDVTAQYDTPYTYTARAVNGLVESETSKPKSVEFPDTFAPAPPTGLTVLAAPSSIELSWQRSPEVDFKSYRVYRSTDGAAFQPVGGPLAIPAFSDRQVEHGKAYRYRVVAIDNKNNPSDASTTVEVRF